MNAARQTIFNAVARALPAGRHSPAEIAAEARSLLAGPEAIRPSLLSPGVVESFIQRVAGSKVGATVDRVPSIGHVPEAVARQLAARKLPAKAAVQPTAALTVLDWASSGLSLDGAVDGGVGVSLARWGIAETGSLAVHSAADMPILLNFLPGSACDRGTGLHYSSSS